MAIDRQAIIDVVYLGHAGVGRPGASTMWAFNRTLQPCPTTRPPPGGCSPRPVADSDATAASTATASSSPSSS